MAMLQDNRFIFEVSFLEIINLAFTDIVSKLFALKKTVKAK